MVLMVQQIDEEISESETSEKIFKEGLIVNDIVKHPLDLQIFLILFLYEELNVTEISKKLNRSKATVSRHLKQMQEDGILVSQEKKAKGKINPLYYKLPKDTLYKIKRSSSQPINFKELLQPEKRLNFYRQSLGMIKSIVTLMINGMDLVNPIIQAMESKLTDIDTADETFGYFASYFKEGKLKLDPIVISEEQLGDALEFYKEYLDKLRKLRDKSEKNNEQKSLLIVNNILPLKDLLEFDVSEIDE